MISMVVEQLLDFESVVDGDHHLLIIYIYIYVIKSFLFGYRRGLPTRIVPSDERVQVVVVMGSFSPTSVIGDL